MDEFSKTAQALSGMAEEMRDSVDAIGSAIEDNSRGIEQVTTTVSELSTSVASLQKQAEQNDTISRELAGEVGRFKL